MSVRTDARFYGGAGNHGERIYTLTEKGRQILEEASPYWETRRRRLSQTMGDSELRSLVPLCESTVAAAQQAEQLRAVNINIVSEPAEYSRTAAWVRNSSRLRFSPPKRVDTFEAPSIAPISKGDSGEPMNLLRKDYNFPSVERFLWTRPRLTTSMRL